MFGKKFFIPFLLAFAFILISCSDDNSTNTEPSKDNYFPTTVGSWWIYKNTQLDSTGTKVPESETWDTTKIIGSYNISGKMASAFENRSSNGNVDTSYFYTEDGKIYALANLFDNDFIDFDPRQWVLIADFNANSWVILSDTTLASQEIDFPGIGFLKITPTVSITGKKGNKSNLAVGKKSVESQEFIITFAFKLKIEIPGVPFPANATVNVINRYWFGNQVGLVQSKVEPTEINVAGMFQDWLSGSIQELESYSIK